MTAVLTLSQSDSRFPALLKDAKPLVKRLYVRGNVDLLSSNMVAVVGTRRCTPYGKMLTQQFVRGLISYGFTIVSGLAFGIDHWAHRTTLEAKGQTVAVLGSAIDQIHPRRHEQLAQRILEAGGAIVSEYAPGTRCYAHHFPQRNRIISGLAIGTLVMEAPEKSGALITAKWALLQNRDVMAPPGDLTRRSFKGNFHLLANDSAALVRHPEDVIHRLHHQPDLLLSSMAPALTRPKRLPPLETPSQQAVWAALQRTPQTPDALLKTLDCSLSEILVTLSLFELQGHVYRDVDGRYAPTVH